MYHKQRAGMGLVLVWMVVGLACNLPVAPRAEQDDPWAGRETLAAEIFATQTAEVEMGGGGGVLRGGENTPEAAPYGAPDGGGEATQELAAAPQILATTYVDEAGYHYVTQAGDTPKGLAGRFGVTAEQMAEWVGYAGDTLLPMGLVVTIPVTVDGVRYSGLALPDSEIVYSPAAADFSVEQVVAQGNGFLSSYTEEVDGETLTGAQIIERVALETSTNPRLLLAVLEFRAGWVFGQPSNPSVYPIGFYADKMSGLHKEITLAARQCTIGYYGWRAGTFTELAFARGATARIDPSVNAGTAAIQNLFAKLYTPEALQDTLYGPDGFLQKYGEWFGDPWERAQAVGPMLPDGVPDGVQQPVLEVPYGAGVRVNFTGGPHIAWGIGTPNGGVDFAPAEIERKCAPSSFWVTAPAPGIVVRAERGALMLDLDMDGNEHTGWTLLLMHVAEKDRVAVGTQVNTDDPVGHPSCEGGAATGSHVHLARKYNGEWIGTDGPLPFVLSGWQVYAGEKPYYGALVKGEEVVTSRLDYAPTSIFSR